MMYIHLNVKLQRKFDVTVWTLIWGATGQYCCMPEPMSLKFLEQEFED